MKLHLPKTLLAAVLACFTVGASYGVSVDAIWDVTTILSAIQTSGSATRSWNGTTCTFTLSDGMLKVSGYALSNNSLSNITFEAKKTELQELANGTTVSLVLIEYSAHTVGVNVKGTAAGSSSLFTGKADGNNDWTDVNSPRTDVSDMADDGIVSAYFHKGGAPGVTLANGYASQTGKDHCIYFGNGLYWSTAPGDFQSLKFNTTYVTSLIHQADSYQSESSVDFYRVKNADGTWHKDYTTWATAVSETPVGATLVAEGRLEITSSNATSLETNGGDIIVGGSGQLYLNSSSGIDLSKTIYLGGSTYSDATTQGALYFGGSGTTTLSGGITLIENSTMGDDAQAQNVLITGNVTGNYKLAIVQGTGIDFTGGMNLGTLELASGVSIDIKNQAANVGTFANAGGDAPTTVNVTGTTLTISGLYAGSSNVLNTEEGGEIVFGQNAAIDVSNLTAEGNSDFALDGFIQESYRVTASNVNARIEGETIALVKGGASFGSATWSDGKVTMGEIIYNVVSTKSYNNYLTESAAAGKTADSILVQEGGIFEATNATQTIRIAGADIGVGTLAAQWTGRAEAGANISTAAKTFHGAVVVKSGTSWLIGNGYSFSSVSVEDGGQFGLDGTYTGNIIISGTGVTTSTDAKQKNGALQFGGGGTLIGNVTILGNKAALSTLGEAVGTITGNINCTAGGAELEILNSATPAITTNTITVSGNLSGINKVTTTDASMTVTGTIENFGDTFTKSGAGTLTLSRVSAITGGKVIVEEGMLNLTSGSNAAGALTRVAVEVKAGATIKVGHDSAGWNGGTSSISLTGEEGNVAKMINNDMTVNGNTWNTNIYLNGYATVTDGKLMSFGGSLFAEDTGNTFGSQLSIAKNFTVTVSEGGELEISGQIVDSGHGGKVDTAKLIKEGAGTLKLTHANNTFTRGGIALNAGTLTIDNNSATTTAAGISGDGTLTTSGNGAKTFSDDVDVASVTFGGGAVTFSQNADLVLRGASELNTDVTLNGKLSMANGNTMTIDAGKTLTHEGFTYTAGEADGSISKTADSTTDDGNNDANIVSALYSTGTTVRGVTMTKTASGDKTVNFALDNVHFINEGGTTTLNHSGNRLSALEISGGTVKFGANASIADSTGSTGNTSDHAPSVEVSGDGVLEISGDNGVSVTAGSITARANGSESGTAKKVTINSSGISGTTTTNEGGDTLQEMGELSSMTLTFAAENTAATISHVTMRDVTLSSGAVTLGDTVVAIASAAPAEATSPARMMALSADADAGSADTQTLTATTVKSGGSISGTLTVDIDDSVLSPDNAGKNLTWTILDNVSLASGEGKTFTLELGKNLTDMLRNGQPKVTLSGDWVLDNDGQPLELAFTDLGSLSTGNLLVAPVDDAGRLVAGSLVLKVENLPEPTTGTLSVLALAALAARRRRRE